MKTIISSASSVIAMSAIALLCASLASAGQAKVDLTGKWLFTVETGAGSGTPTITLKQDGEKLTGHYSGQLGEADITGTAKGNDMQLKFTVDVQGTALNCIYTGGVDAKDSMKGKVEIVGLGEGTFTAKKQ
ncbi:MAG TPA: hypothetical protein VGH34_18955 [Vicinamibacterales bacterium]